MYFYVVVYRFFFLKKKHVVGRGEKNTTSIVYPASVFNITFLRWEGKRSHGVIWPYAIPQLLYMYSASSAIHLLNWNGFSASQEYLNKQIKNTWTITEQNAILLLVDQIILYKTDEYDYGSQNELALPHSHHQQNKPLGPCHNDCSVVCDSTSNGAHTAQHLCRTRSRWVGPGLECLASLHNHYKTKQTRDIQIISLQPIS